MGRKKKEIDLSSKVLDVKTTSQTIEYLTENAFVGLYAAMKLGEVEEGLSFIGIIGGQTFELNFTKK